MGKLVVDTAQAGYRKSSPPGQVVSTLTRSRNLGFLAPSVALLWASVTLAPFVAPLHRLSFFSRPSLPSLAQGQRAHVGKVSMDRNSPPDYVESSAAQGLKDVERFVDYVQASSLPEGKELVTPAIIPRFVPTW